MGMSRAIMPTGTAIAAINLGCVSPWAAAGFVDEVAEAAALVAELGVEVGLLEGVEVVGIDDAATSPVPAALSGPPGAGMSGNEGFGGWMLLSEFPAFWAFRAQRFTSFIFSGVDDK